MKQSTVKIPQSSEDTNETVEKQIVPEIKLQQPVHTDQNQKQEPKPKQKSVINNLFANFKEKIREKEKVNPLFIDQDIQDQDCDEHAQQQKMEDTKRKQRPSGLKTQNQLRLQANSSILSLPPDIRQQALDIIAHDSNKIQEIFDQINPEVSVQIIDSIQKGSALSKYTLYTIKGQDMHGGFIIKRKFTQFLALRKILLHRWPGSFIAGLKNKVDIQNPIQRQKLTHKILINFLVCLSYLKHIHYKEQVQLFLRSPDIDISEMFDQMPELKITDLVSRFQYAFGQPMQQVKQPLITQILSLFHKKLRKIISKLQQMLKTTLKLAQSYDTYRKNVNKFGEVMRLYEHFSLAAFTENNREKTILVKDDNRKIDKLNQILVQNPFYELFNLLDVEIIDAKSFLETLISIDMFYLRQEQLQKQINQKQKDKQQAEAGTSTIKNMTNRKPKEEIFKALGQKLIQLKQQKQQTQHIYTIVQNITLQHIIPTFKTIKKNNYRIVLLKWTEIVGQQIPQLDSIWKFIHVETAEITTKSQRHT